MQRPIIKVGSKNSAVQCRLAVCWRLNKFLQNKCVCSLEPDIMIEIDNDDDDDDDDEDSEDDENKCVRRLFRKAHYDG